MPTVVVVTNTQTVERKLDRMILVAGLERATYSSLFEPIEILARCRYNIAGMEVNFVDQP